MLEFLALPIALMYEKIWDQWEIIFFTTIKTVEFPASRFPKPAENKPQRELHTPTKSHISITHTYPSKNKKTCIDWSQRSSNVLQA